MESCLIVYWKWEERPSSSSVGCEWGLGIGLERTRQTNRGGDSQRWWDWEWQKSGEKEAASLRLACTRAQRPAHLPQVMSPVLLRRQCWQCRLSSRQSSRTVLQVTSYLIGTDNSVKMCPIFLLNFWCSPAFLLEHGCYIWKYCRVTHRPEQAL